MAPCQPARGPILVVEDDVLLRSLVTEALQQAGYRVLAAANGYLALALARSHPPSLILLDLLLPLMDGGQFLAAYHRLPGPHAPVIVMSGAADGAALAEGLEAVDYLKKPFTVADLTRHLSRGLECC